MTYGWICVNLPKVLLRTGHWHIQVGEVKGHPGELIALPAAVYQVIIRAAHDWEHTKLSFKLVIEVSILDGRVTNIRLPLPEQIMQVCYNS